MHPHSFIKPVSPPRNTGSTQSALKLIPSIYQPSSAIIKLALIKIEGKHQSCSVLEGCAGFEFFTSGTSQLQTSEANYDIVPGTLVFLQPGEKYILRVNGDHSLIRFRCQFKDISSFRRFLPKGLPLYSEPLQIQNLKWANQILEQMKECLDRYELKSEKLCVLLMDYFFERIQFERESSILPSSHAQKTYERIRNYLEANYTTINRISEVSTNCHLSLPHLSRLFKQFSSEKPSELLNRLKLEKAADLILSGECLIKEAAMSVGFEDSLYFSNRFKKHFGVSPKFYRNSKIEVFPNKEQQKVS